MAKQPPSPVQQRLEYALLRSAVGLTSVLPERVARRFGSSLSGLWWRLDERHRRIGMTNLSIAFPDWTDDRREEVLRDSLLYLGRMAADVCQSRNWGESDMLQRVQFEESWMGPYLKDLVQSRTGILFYTAHTGAWELIPPMWALSCRPMHAVARPIDNPRVDTLVTNLRERFGTRIIGKRGALREIMKSMSQGADVAMLVDQNTTRSEGLFIDFFGKPACSNYALPLFALRSKRPLVGGFSFFDIDRNIYRVRIVKEIPLEPSGDRDADIRRVTQTMHSHIEQMIRDHPRQWLWMHRRWRTRPEGENLPPLYDKN